MKKNPTQQQPQKQQSNLPGAPVNAAPPAAQKGNFETVVTPSKSTKPVVDTPAQQKPSPTYAAPSAPPAAMPPPTEPALAKMAPDEPAIPVKPVPWEPSLITIPPPGGAERPQDLPMFHWPVLPLPDETAAIAPDTVRENAGPMSSAPAAQPAPVTEKAFQIDVDIAGADYRHFDLERPRPRLCQQVCLDEQECRAWTFYRAGLLGPRAVCWLKSGIPTAQQDTCCISGVK